ncbi:phosphotyrosine protein phosphatase [Georgenia muralis]|uniref:Protein-tyrosine-phosphatase n=1 Tax=Georgenia muralis TaxID=154117 RepID=A0A3N4ZR30_9MICO|nr:phosphotyrosine protein phosphatase [Georgenia muralis]RPF28002.1 protein-tyrosine-phosphatase [Georgenia muralis]
MSGRCPVLFVGAHNSGRSQMAGGYLRALCGGRVDVRTAGAEHADEVDPVVVVVMAEEGIDLGAVRPSVLSPSDVVASDVVITVGGADVCPYFHGVRYQDWEFEDPAVKDMECVRAVRQEIRLRVEGLLTDLPAVAPPVLPPDAATAGSAG